MPVVGLLEEPVKGLGSHLLGIAVVLGSAQSHLIVQEPPGMAPPGPLIGGVGVQGAVTAKPVTWPI